MVMSNPRVLASYKSLDESEGNYYFCKQKVAKNPS